MYNKVSVRQGFGFGSLVVSLIIGWLSVGAASAGVVSKGHANLPHAAFIALDGAVFSVGSTHGDGESYSDEDSRAGMRLRLGASLSPFVDLEGQLGFSFNDEDEADHAELGVYGVYLKGYLPIGPYSSLYASGGMTVIDINSTVPEANAQSLSHSPTHSPTHSESGSTGRSYGSFSYGFGLETRLTDYLDLTADYMSYLSETDSRAGVSAVTFGLKLYF